MSARGAKCSDFLGRYLTEEGIDKGSGVFLWQLLGAVFPLSASAFVFYVAAAVTLMAVLALLVVMRDRKPDADLAGAMLLAVTITLLFSPHYAWYFAWLVPFLCFYPVVGVLYLDLRLQLPLFRALASDAVGGLRDLRTLSSHSHRRVCSRAGRRKLETRHADANAQLETKVDPRRYFESAGKTRATTCGAAAGLRLSGDDEPLQSAVHDVPAHL